MENVLIVLILLVVLGLAAWYVIRSKKRGKKCIGCPEGCCSAEQRAHCCGKGRQSQPPGDQGGSAARHIPVEL